MPEYCVNSIPALDRATHNSRGPAHRFDVRNRTKREVYVRNRTKQERNEPITCHLHFHGFADADHAGNAQTRMTAARCGNPNSADVIRPAIPVSQRMAQLRKERGSILDNFSDAATVGTWGAHNAPPRPRRRA